MNFVCDECGIIVFYSSETQDEDEVNWRERKRERERCEEKVFDCELDESCWTEVRKN